MLHYLERYKIVIGALAPTLALIVAAFTLYARLSALTPAIAPGDVVVQRERDLAGQAIVASGNRGAVAQPGAFKHTGKLRMTSKAAVIIWYDNLREDCILSSRLVTITSQANEQHVIGSFAGGALQGPIGPQISLLAVVIPSNILPGTYRVDVNAVYSCAGSITNHAWKPTEIEVTY